MVSWFLVGCVEVSVSPSKSCFRCVFVRGESAQENVADWTFVILWYIVLRLSVGGYRRGICLYRLGGRSFKVAVYVGGFRHGRDSIFLPSACWRFYCRFHTDRQGCNDHLSSHARVGTPAHKAHVSFLPYI
ncbi:hypothetical protein NDU88_005959 [Pleurodeles waltl]|uniref:Secreted protein n=1 Tax=Pleurodeles waltl TaxID=8319 RepID=A0AAV7X2S9_PLEWA|nr:hypothetical protein NDU88_005959 [Pleurodeles waltl]